MVAGSAVRSASSGVKSVVGGATSKGGLTIFMVVALSVHLFEIFGGRLAGGNISLFDLRFIIIHLFFVPVAGAFLIPGIRAGKGLASLWGFGLAAYLLPLALQIPFLEEIIKSVLGAFVYTAVLVFMPVWVVFFITRSDDMKAKWLSILVGIYSFLWVISVLIIFSIPAFANPDFGPSFVAEGVGGLLSDSLVELGRGVSVAWGSIVRGSDTVKQGLSGNVTPKNVARVVSPSDFKAVVLFDSPYVLGAPPYTRDNDLEVEARLRVKTFSDDHKFSVSLSCSTPGAPSDNVHVSVSSMDSSVFVAEGVGEQSESVNCLIDGNTLNAGSHKISLSASYDMVGFSRIEFVAGNDEQFDRDSSGNFRPKNSELSKAMPPAIVSSAPTPLKVSIGSSEKYLVLRDKDDDSIFGPSVSLERTDYDGKAVVHDVTIIAPKLLRLDSVRPYGDSLVKIDCAKLKERYSFVSLPCIDSSEDVYIVDTNNMSVETSARLSLVFSLSRESRDRFLRGASFALKNIYVLSSYSFVTKKDKSVQVGLSADEAAQRNLLQFPVILTGPAVVPSIDGARIELEVDRQSRIFYSYWKKGRESDDTSRSSNYAQNHVITLTGLDTGADYEVKLEISDRQNRRTVKNVEFSTLSSPSGGPSS